MPRKKSIKLIPILIEAHFANEVEEQAYKNTVTSVLNSITTIMEKNPRNKIIVHLDGVQN